MSDWVRGGAVGFFRPASFCSDHITSEGWSTGAWFRCVKESSSVMVTPLDLLLSSLCNPSLWLLLCPSLPPSPPTSSHGVSGGGVHVRERAGAAGNKCLIITLIIIPWEFDSEEKEWNRHIVTECLFVCLFTVCTAHIFCYLWGRKLYAIRIPSKFYKKTHLDSDVNVQIFSCKVFCFFLNEDYV